MVADMSKITHSHHDAILGAQLETAAVYTALHQQVRQNKIDLLFPSLLCNQNVKDNKLFFKPSD